MPLLGRMAVPEIVIDLLHYAADARGAAEETTDKKAREQMRAIHLYFEGIHGACLTLHVDTSTNGDAFVQIRGPSV